MTDLLPASTHEKLKCAEREVALRRKAYPRWIEKGKISAKDADRQITIMEAIAHDYREKLAREKEETKSAPGSPPQNWNTNRNNPPPPTQENGPTD